MATETIERTIPGRQGDELFKEVEKTLDPYVKKYSVHEKIDAEHRHISVKKTGMSGELQVEDEKVICKLDYSPLMPGPLRQQITKAVDWTLDQMVPPANRRTEMATEKIERTIPGRQGDELFKTVEQTLDPYVKKFSLQEKVDPEHRHISVKRMGMSGELQVEGDKVSCELDYSALIPGPIRNQITKGVTAALDQMAAK